MIRRSIVSSWIAVLIALGLGVATAQTDEPPSEFSRHHVVTQTGTGMELRFLDGGTFRPRALRGIDGQELHDLLFDRTYVTLNSYQVLGDDSGTLLTEMLDGRRKLGSPLLPLSGITLPGGPFGEGFGFDRIQILIGAGGLGPVVGLYFNDFFADAAGKHAYDLYFARPLPTDPTPDLDGTPGAFPAIAASSSQSQFADDPSTALGEILLEMKQLRFTSQYGGSIALDFRMTETYGFECRRGAYLWDIGSLTMTIFVIPVRGPTGEFSFNKEMVGGAMPAAREHIEFDATDVEVYEVIDESASRLRRLTGDASADAPSLDDVLADVAGYAEVLPRLAASPGTTGPRSIAFGFVHYRSSSLFDGSDDKVVGVHIADGACELVTEERQTWVTVLGSVIPIDFSFGVDGEGETLEGWMPYVTKPQTTVVRTDAELRLPGGPMPVFSAVERIPPGEIGREHILTSFALDECGSVGGLRTRVDMTADGPVWNTHLGTFLHELDFECVAMTDLDAATNWSPSTSRLRVVRFNFTQTASIPPYWSGGLWLHTVTYYDMEVQLRRR